MRKISSLAAVALLAVAALSGCASTSSSASAIDVPMACKHFVTGKATADITAKIPASGKPTITFAAPISTTSTETKVLKEGTGTLFGGDQQVTFDYLAIDAATGKELQGSSWTGADAASQIIAKSTGSGANFCDALAGNREGAVVATLLSAKDSHNSQANPAAGIGKNDSILFVFHLRKVYLARATGDAKPAQDGFPQVVTNAAGVPGLVMQNWDTSAAPKTFKSEVLIEGKGEVVHANDFVTVHYSGYLWSSAKTLFDSSWTKGTPATFQLKAGALIPGFIKALVGQHVGSQVVAVLPPSDGYGSTGAGSIPANSTLIFVIDILGKGK